MAIRETFTLFIGQPEMGQAMKYPVNRSALHALPAIGHDAGGVDDNGARRRTSKAQSREDAVEHYLLSLAKENPMRLFCVGDIRTIFHMGKKTMTRLRKLAEKDPISDPWEGDLTNPEQFAKWYWGKRRELQSQFPIN
ncbi:MAG: hypothetical protein ABJB22_06535 [Verrucomicrobiota bacterium]